MALLDQIVRAKREAVRARKGALRLADLRAQTNRLR